MEFLESESKFKILSDRFIGVYFDKNKLELSEDEADYTESYWQIYDAKTQVVYPDKFKFVVGFWGNIGVVQSFDDKFKYIRLENNNKFKFLKSYTQASLLADKIGVVKNEHNSMNYVIFKDGQIVDLPQKFFKCYAPTENYGIVEDIYGAQSYVYITPDEVKPIGQKFIRCEPVKEGIGRVQGSNKRWYYAVLDGDKIKVLYDSFVNCYAIKDGVGRVVNDDKSMNYVKIVGDQVVDISKPYKDCSAINEGVCRVRHDDDTFSLFRIDEEGKFKPIGARIYDANTNRTLMKYVFPNCQNLQDNTTVVVNNDKETVSFATYEDKQLVIKGKSFKNANSLRNNVGKVEYKDGTFGYVFNDNGTMIDLGGNYNYCKDFSEGFGIVGKKNKQCYVKVVSKNDPNNKFMLVEMLSKKGHPQEFVSCEDYKNGFGVVQTVEGKFAVVGKDGKMLEETPFVPAKINIKLMHERNNGGLKKIQQAKRDRVYDTYFSR